MVSTSVRRFGARRVAAAAFLVLPLVAACSSGDDDDAGDTAAATQETSGETPAETTPDESTTVDEPTTTTGDEQADDSGGDGCDLVSDEVVTEVLGIDIARAEPHQDDFGRSCIKGNERSDDPTQFTYVSVSVITGGAILVDEASAESDSTPVDGLGDRAVFVTSAGVLFIAVGDDGIQVQVVREGVPGTQEEATTIAEDVLSRV